MTTRLDNRQLERLLRERSAAAVDALFATVEVRDASTAAHSRRVQRLSVGIGRQLELSRPELDVLGHAALFHDIGKLAIPDAILNKSGPLDPEEWRLIRRHPEEGARIIERLGFFCDAVPAVRHHHERFDGSGYPDELCGDEIPLGARIIGVAEAYDSMMTAAIYRGALTEDVARSQVAEHTGTQFDPLVAGAFAAIVEDAYGVVTSARWRRTGLASAAEAKALVAEILSDGDWHSSRDIHRQLRHRLSEGMFCRVKRELGIEHRRLGGGHANYYEWRLPTSGHDDAGRAGAVVRDRFEPRASLL